MIPYHRQVVTVVADAGVLPEPRRRWTHTRHSTDNGPPPSCDAVATRSACRRKACGTFLSRHTRRSGVHRSPRGCSPAYRFLLCLLSLPLAGTPLYDLTELFFSSPFFFIRFLFWSLFLSFSSPACMALRLAARLFFFFYFHNATGRLSASVPV